MAEADTRTSEYHLRSDLWPNVSIEWDKYTDEERDAVVQNIRRSQILSESELEKLMKKGVPSEPPTSYPSIRNRDEYELYRVKFNRKYRIYNTLVSQAQIQNYRSYTTSREPFTVDERRPSFGLTPKKPPPPRGGSTHCTHELQGKTISELQRKFEKYGTRWRNASSGSEKEGLEKKLRELYERTEGEDAKRRSYYSVRTCVPFLAPSLVTQTYRGRRDLSVQTRLIQGGFLDFFMIVVVTTGASRAVERSETAHRQVGEGGGGRRRTRELKEWTGRRRVKACIGTR